MISKAKNFRFGLILFFVSILPLYAQAEHKKQWEAHMQGFYSNLTGLLTDVCSDSRFYDVANKKRIEAEVEQLASLAHSLPETNDSKLNSDALFPQTAAMLKRQLEAAADELKHGNRIYARALLRTIPSYCIACHTRNESGPQFAKLNFEPASIMNKFERGEFFAASRQFDRALQEFLSVIENPSEPGTNKLMWGKAIQEALAVAVRVKKDPIVAKKIVQALLKADGAPEFMREDAIVWNSSIDAWIAEKLIKNPSEEELFSSAKQLLAKATELQKYPMDRNADIYYWRASAVLHDLMQLAPNGAHSEEALLLAGICYEVLNPLELEDIHQIFYETCIRKSPHTSLANTCFNRLEASILSQYSSVSGTDITKNLLGRLQELKALAQTK